MKSSYVLLIGLLATVKIGYLCADMTFTITNATQSDVEITKVITCVPADPKSIVTSSSKGRYQAGFTQTHNLLGAAHMNDQIGVHRACKVRPGFPQVLASGKSITYTLQDTSYGLKEYTGYVEARYQGKVGTWIDDGKRGGGDGNAHSGGSRIHRGEYVQHLYIMGPFFGELKIAEQ